MGHVRGRRSGVGHVRGRRSGGGACEREEVWGWSM